MVFEIVIEKPEEAQLAEKYGAKRVELCTALDLGGLTPSYGLIKGCIELYDLEVHVMIRPRAGGFVYSRNEFAVMKEDVTYAAKAGSKGVVFGLLNTDGTIDNRTKALTKHAKSHGLEVTFHRAIDFCDDVFVGLKTLINIGIDRVLTSGHEPNVSQGMETISKLKNQAAGKIQIMAGGGVDETNAKQLINLNIDAIHFGIRILKPGVHNAQMGSEYDLNEEKIKAISGLLKQTYQK